jgi:hypothetical protein
MLYYEDGGWRKRFTLSSPQQYKEVTEQYYALAASFKNTVLTEGWLSSRVGFNVKVMRKIVALFVQILVVWLKATLLTELPQVISQRRHKILRCFSIQNTYRSRNASCFLSPSPPYLLKFVTYTPHFPLLFVIVFSIY